MNLRRIKQVSKKEEKEQKQAEDKELKQKLVYVPDDLFFFKNYTIKDMAIFYSKLYPKFDMDFVKEFGFKTRSAFYQYCVDLGFAKTKNLFS